MSDLSDVPAGCNATECVKTLARLVNLNCTIGDRIKHCLDDKLNQPKSKKGLQNVN